MQKLNEKKILRTVPKKLQLVETFWDCPEFSKNKQNQKGITLIALIITIIVMLILVGVTINVALNGGLFEKAEEAAEQTQLASEKEQLMMAAIGAFDLKTGVDFANMELPEIFEGENGTYTSKETGKTYTVNQETAEITEEAEQKIEYFGGIFTDDGSEYEVVWVFDYSNKIMKGYSGEAGGKLTFGSTIKFTDIITNYEKPFYVIENGETIDIGTGATKIIREDSPNNNNFIINGKCYFDEVEGNETEGVPLLPNFDATRLVEE